MKDQKLTEEKSRTAAQIADEYKAMAEGKIKEENQEVLNNALIVKTRTVSIKNEADRDIGLELLAGLKAYLRSKEDARKEKVEPLRKVIKLIDAESKKITDRVEAAIDWLGEKLKAFRVLEDAKIAAENAKTLARIKAEQEKTAKAFDKAGKGLRGEAKELFKEQKQEAIAKVEEAVVLKTAEKTVGGTSFIKKWKAELIDESKVERDMCSPDQTKANRAVAAGRREIPGYRVYEDTILSTRL